MSIKKIAAIMFEQAAGTHDTKQGSSPLRHHQGQEQSLYVASFCQTSFIGET